MLFLFPQNFGITVYLIFMKDQNIHGLKTNGLAQGK